ncbi:hypothetical protein PoB_007621800 [Plakobranchus ocellatus]|uniref:PH domain-containing protein n=1 Tax=Plakobranchus ocellatus TaxID=259542 RepID=A0AAV4DZL0_9GAST|nr:hypothetical protein PoB_007621800 [Plakobranchus ocellatus]
MMDNTIFSPRVFDRAREKWVKRKGRSRWFLLIGRTRNKSQYFVSPTTVAPHHQVKTIISSVFVFAPDVEHARLSSANRSWQSRSVCCSLSALVAHAPTRCHPPPHPVSLAMSLRCRARFDLSAFSLQSFYNYRH